MWSFVTGFFHLAFEIIFVCCMRQGSTFILLHVDIQLSWNYWLNLLLGFSWCPCQKLIGHKCEELLLDLTSIPLIYIYILMPVSHCLDYWSFVVIFEIKNYESFNFVFFKIVLFIMGLLNFHMNFRISLLISTDKPTGILMGFCVGFVDQIGEYCHFNSIKSSDPWAWDISPFILVFFSVLQ